MKDAIIQIRVQPKQKELIQKYIQIVSLKQNKNYSISTFLSQSIMKMVEQHNQEIEQFLSFLHNKN